jgi:hypothetical protein
MKHENLTTLWNDVQNQLSDHEAHLLLGLVSDEKPCIDCVRIEGSVMEFDLNEESDMPRSVQFNTIQDAFRVGSLMKMHFIASGKDIPIMPIDEPWMRTEAPRD